jgi:hypothetical protein
VALVNRSWDSGTQLQGRRYWQSTGAHHDGPVLLRSAESGTLTGVRGLPTTDNAFNLRKVRWDGGHLNCVNKQGLVHEDWPQPDNIPGAVHLTLPPTTLTAAKVAARTNPSRPVVDVPVLIAELGDVPKLIRLAGRTIYGKAGSAYLSWQFGWAPLLGDLNKLLDFGSHVSNRVQEIKRLNSRGGLKRRIGPVNHENVLQSTGWGVSETKNGWVSVYSRRETRRKQWATARWRSTVPNISEAHAQILATRSTLGLDLTMSTVWEALPWSWMADWFGNVGDYLMGSRNTVPAQLVSCCVMTHTRTEMRHVLVNLPSGASYDPPWWDVDDKVRSPSLPSVTASVPFLDPGRLAIVAALTGTWLDRNKRFRLGK